MGKQRNRRERNKSQWRPTPLAERLPLAPSARLFRAYVEGYGDVSFWRGIFDEFETERLRFEIDVPQRSDLAKGKQALMKMIENGPRPDEIFCMDSDFDYLFDGASRQSHIINTSANIFQTYAYASENYLCYAPSLHYVCVKATKNDVRIFDFERFMADYSRTIYPLFLWYAHSALALTENRFPLIDFRSSVKLNYLEVNDNGRSTIEWLERQVSRRIESLEGDYPEVVERIPEFEKLLRSRGATPENIYLYMQGHTLLDNVVMVVLNAVCDQLKLMTTTKINVSARLGQALRNEVSNYNNELRNVREILLDNENFKECFLYKKLRDDIARYVSEL
ncbi:MAG: DUF4435 domain-containing protein [Rikenellaceae bacterium]|jgi:hypothetical protein|nr:DUF4435 domain-containing protein [Rikenellaceae bacterium]